MKRGKEEESGKIVSPLFPRLHINDTCKGGPRAPPRNKMALYEQLSVPSPRSSDSLPLQHHNSCTPSMPLASHGEGRGYERSLFPPYCLPSQLPAGSSGNVHSNSSNTMSINSARVLDRKSSKHVTVSNVSGPLQSANECYSFHPHSRPSPKASCDNRSENDDHFKVPAFIKSGIHSYLSKDRNVAMGTPLQASRSHKIAAVGPSVQFESSPRNVLGKCRNTVSSLDKNAKNSKEDVAKATTFIKHIEKPSSELRSGEKMGGSLNTGSLSLVEEHASEEVTDSQRCKRRCEEYIGSSRLGRVGGSADAGAAGKAGASRIKTGLENHNSHGNGPEDPQDVKETGPSGHEEVNENDEDSETSILDTIPCFDMSPDVVVGVIGPKHFWKARRAIVNQQRIFAVQVFELHRLIRVQKLIAALPHLLIEGNPCFGSPEVPSTGQPHDNTVKSKQQPRLKDETNNANTNQQCSKANAKKVSSPPEKCLTLVQEDGLCSGNPSVDPVASQNQPSPWCFQPPGNQWLVPVMSPSEGLVYKPYAGPCPPTAGFIPPVFGGFGPIPQLTPSYGIPTFQQPQNPSIHYGTNAVPSHYCPSPYRVAVASPVVSASASQQRSNEKPKQQSRMSCNLLKSRSKAISGSAWKVLSSKDSDLQGSTASSPAERVHDSRSPLPLFPTAPCNEDSDQSLPSRCRDNPTQVIKVVPHNPLSATESAARIFLSIQKERQQYCNM